MSDNDNELEKCQGCGKLMDWIDNGYGGLSQACKNGMCPGYGIIVDPDEEAREEPKPYLKPCPFCGCSNINYEPGEWGMWCNNCGYGFSSEYSDDFSESVTSWNTRPIEDALHAELAAARLRIAALEAELREYQE
jgi:hypothetical protein